MAMITQSYSSNLLQSQSSTQSYGADRRDFVPANLDDFVRTAGPARTVLRGTRARRDLAGRNPVMIASALLHWVLPNLQSAKLALDRYARSSSLLAHALHHDRERRDLSLRRGLEQRRVCCRFEPAIGPEYRPSPSKKHAALDQESRRRQSQRGCAGGRSGSEKGKGRVGCPSNCRRRPDVRGLGESRAACGHSPRRRNAFGPHVEEQTELCNRRKRRPCCPRRLTHR